MKKPAIPAGFGLGAGPMPAREIFECRLLLPLFRRSPYDLDLQPREEQMGKFVRYLGYVVLAAGFLFIVAGYVGVFLQQGFGAVLDLLNPFNVWNFIATVAVLIPGLLLVALGKHLEERRSS